MIGGLSGGCSLNANLDTPSEISGPSGPCGAVAGGSSRQGGAARRNKGLPPPPAASSLPATGGAALSHQQLSGRSSFRSGRARLLIRRGKSRPNSLVRQPRQHGGPASIRVAAFAPQAKGEKPEPLPSCSWRSQSSTSSLVQHRAWSDRILGAYSRRLGAWFFGLSCRHRDIFSARSQARL